MGIIVGGHNYVITIVGGHSSMDTSQWDTIVNDHNPMGIIVGDHNYVDTMVYGHNGVWAQ